MQVSKKKTVHQIVMAGAAVAALSAAYPAFAQQSGGTLKILGVRRHIKWDIRAA